MITDAELAGAIARLAVNFGKAFDDDDAVMALVKTWRDQLAKYDVADLELALKGLFADPNERFFPTVAEVRRRVVLARVDRQREEGHGIYCPACEGMGWQEWGTDAMGRLFVRPCPQGCKPPLPRNDTTSARLDDDGQVAFDFAAAVAGARRAMTAPVHDLGDF